MIPLKVKQYAKAVLGGAALVAGAVVGLSGLPTWVKSTAAVVIVVAGVLGIVKPTNAPLDKPVAPPAP